MDEDVVESIQPREDAARLPAWQRSFRHLRGLTFAGLPFDPNHHGNLYVELHALPPAASVQLELGVGAGGRVIATFRVVTLAPPVTGFISRTSLAAFSLRSMVCECIR